MGPDYAELVKLARDGDGDAWTALVKGLERLVWRVTADFRLSAEDRKDVFAAAFYRLFERLDTIRTPEKLPGWMATTARNEARTILRSRTRIETREDFADQDAGDPPSDDNLLREELRAALPLALRRLSPPCQDLLRLLTAVPKIPYEEIQTMLNMKHGSIGPTRQRCLERLRNTPELRPFLEGGER